MQCRRHSLKALFLPLLLSALVSIALGACSSQAPESTQANGADEAAAPQEETLPRRLIYDDEYYTVESIDFYQGYSDYEYYLYAVVKFDLSEMTEAGQHWLLEHDPTGLGFVLDAEVSVADEVNTDVDGVRLRSAGRYIDGSTVYYFFYSDKARDSFEGQEYELYVSNYDIDRLPGPDDPRIYDSYLFYYGTIPSGLSAPEAMPSDVYQALADNLRGIVDALASF